MKKVLITGGSRGLGKEIIGSLLEQGYKIVCLDIIKEDKIEKKYLSQIDYFQVDLSDKTRVTKVIAEILAKYNSIDVFIHNASVRKFKNFEDFSVKEIEAYSDVNLISAQIILLKLLPGMKSSNFGRIVFISSMSGFHGYSTGSLYCSSKGAMVLFIESISKELRREQKNITANIICPDGFRTLDGEKLKDYDRIIRSIISNINKILLSEKNGAILRVAKFSRIFVDLLKYLKKIVLN